MYVGLLVDGEAVGAKVGRSLGDVVGAMEDGLKVSPTDEGEAVGTAEGEALGE